MALQITAFDVITKNGQTGTVSTGKQFEFNGEPSFDEASSIRSSSSSSSASSSSGSSSSASSSGSRSSSSSSDDSSSSSEDSSSSSDGSSSSSSGGSSSRADGESSSSSDSQVSMLQWINNTAAPHLACSQTSETSIVVPGVLCLYSPKVASPHQGMYGHSSTV